MNKTEINAKLQYVFEGLEISKQQKNMLYDVIGTIIDAIIEGASDTVPVATGSKVGGVKINAEAVAEDEFDLKLDNRSAAYTKVPKASTTKAGLMSKEDKSKLDNVADNANNYTHPTTPGNKHIPSGGSAGQVLTWSADGTAVWDTPNNYTLPAATKTTLGGVKQAATVAALDAEDEIATVISTVNTLISNLKASGAVANS